MKINGVDTSEQNICGPLAALDVLYDSMPKTHGCERCKAVNGDEEIWCCRYQNPSMFYVEFLKVFQFIQVWSKCDRANIVIRCIKNYLSNDKQKGCPFWDGKCLVYDVRPFNCRMYGVVPEINWRRRWDQLKDREGDNFESRSQCDLVSTVSGSPITAEDEDKWFKHILRTEHRLGVPQYAILLHDEPGGTYRTFHDHMLMEVFDPDTLGTLTKVKLTHPSKDDIEQTIKIIKANFLK